MDYNSVIVNYLIGCASDDEIRELNNWISESDENRRIFNELSDIWSATGLKKDNEYDVISNFAKIRAKLDETRQTPVITLSALKWYRIAIGIAAVMVAGLILSLFFVLRNGHKISGSNYVQQITEISAPMGSKTRIILPDSTKVWLNAGSTITYNSSFNSSNRNITLQGEAYFDVKKNKDIPFLVLTPEITIKVLGTAFNVKAYASEGSVETTLERGALIVEQTSHNGENTQTILAPHQRATFVRQTGKMLLSDTEAQILKKNNIQRMESVAGKVLISKEIDTEIFTAWKDNKLVFRNETFESLAVKLERWYGVKIILTDEEIKNMHFNGTIENETINDVLDVVKLAKPIKYSIQHNIITITKQN